MYGRGPAPPTSCGQLRAPAPPAPQELLAQLQKQPRLACENGGTLYLQGWLSCGCGASTEVAVQARGGTAHAARRTELSGRSQAARAIDRASRRRDAFTPSPPLLPQHKFQSCARFLLRPGDRGQERRRPGLIAAFQSEYVDLDPNWLQRVPRRWPQVRTSGACATWLRAYCCAAACARSTLHTHLPSLSAHSCLPHHHTPTDGPSTSGAAAGAEAGWDLLRAFTTADARGGAAAAQRFLSTPEARAALREALLVRRGALRPAWRLPADRAQGSRRGGAAYASGP
jgi:hypothetical protein